MNPEILANLRRALAELYTDEVSIQRIMADAGVSSVQIKFNVNVIDLWHLVLTEAAKIDRIEALLVVVEGDEYGSNPQFRQACAAYRHSQTMPPNLPNPPPALPLPMINHEQAVLLFRQLLQPDAQWRFMRLQGAGNMGKTTLVSKVFPALAQHHRMRHAVVDLRNPAQSPPELLDVACQQLDPGRFPSFAAAYEALLEERRQQRHRPAAEFTQAMGRDLAEPEAGARQDFSHLTRKFVQDLRVQSEQTLVLLFDAVDLANPSTQTWLMDDLLASLRPLPHLRVVVAGRRLPPPASSYAAACHDHELRPVLDEMAYVRYCQAIGANLLEAQIRLLAQNSGYSPGAFAGIAQNFVPRERRHG